MRIRPFPALAILLAVGAVSVTSYHLATMKARLATEEDKNAMPQDDSPAPVLLSQPAARVVAGNEEAREEAPEETPASLHQLRADRLADLAVHSGSAWTRADALEELVARTSTQALPVLVDRLADPDGDVRRVAADGLAELGNQTALAALERALPTESVERARLAMAQAIAELRQDSSSASAE